MSAHCCYCRAPLGILDSRSTEAAGRGVCRHCGDASSRGWLVESEREPWEPDRTDPIKRELNRE